MFAGHIGAALALGRAEPELNVGVLVAAALLLDILLWLFVLLGWESVVLPANFVSTHQAEFVFPYSHGLLASVLWSLLAALLGLCLYRRLPTRGRIALLVAAAVFSHWVLDVLVHRPELPLAGPASEPLGLGLWSHLTAALLLESVIAVFGLYLYVSGVRGRRARSIAISVLTLVVLAFTIIGMTLAPAPPSSAAMAGSSLVTLAIVCALAFWIGAPDRTS